MCERPGNAHRALREINLSKYMYAGLVSVLLLSACNDPAPDASASGTVAPESAPELPVVASGPAIRTDAGCTPEFKSPGVGFTTVLGGASSTIAMEYVVTSIEDGRVHATSTTLIGPDQTRGPSHSIVRRDGFVVLEGGTNDARRITSYRPELTRDAIMALRPGGSLSTSVTESSDFEGEAGKRDVRGTYKVTFVGCSDVAIGDSTYPAKVFDVRSVARAYDGRAPEGEREGERETLNRYWVSEQYGWVIRNDDGRGSLVAKSLRTSG